MCFSDVVILVFGVVCLLGWFDYFEFGGLVICDFVILGWERVLGCCGGYLGFEVIWTLLLWVWFTV